MLVTADECFNLGDILTGDESPDCEMAEYGTAGQAARAESRAVPLLKRKEKYHNSQDPLFSTEIEQML